MSRPLRLRIRELRDAKGWSQDELARRAQVRQATISNFERGKTRSVDLDVLDRIAAALRVDPAFLIVRGE
jgi:transcriptional regulator with XRE-family HTH domain